jgi:hypothetical protein
VSPPASKHATPPSVSPQTDFVTPLPRKQVRHATCTSTTVKEFDYTLDYARLDFRRRPNLYRIGRGEQGVLLVEPYKSEILPHWRFRTVAEARASAAAIYRLYRRYRREQDFVGMDMARKFLQMGFTRARRYANHCGGRKYERATKRLLPRTPHDPEKAAAAETFRREWERVRNDPAYVAARTAHRRQFESRVARKLQPKIRAASRSSSSHSGRTR